MKNGKMIKYVIKRLLLALVILFGVSVIIYSLVRMLPVDYVERKFESQLNQGTVKQEDIDKMKELYGINDNSVWGVLSGYCGWVGKMFQGDLGRSFKYDAPVSQVISENMGISFIIAFVALLLQFAVAIPLGIKSATNQYGTIDYTVTILVMMGISLPSYFFAALLIKVFGVQLGWFPVTGLVDATINWDGNAWGEFWNKAWHLVLPIVTMVVLGIGSLMRYTRTNMLEVLNSDYIRTARAKGLSEKTVVYKHAFRNTLIPLVTMMAGILPSLFGGAMIIEQVFAIPGIGQRAYLATVEGDIPFIMGYNMFLAVLTVIGTLLSDLMYAVVDPRVKLAK